MILIFKGLGWEVDQAVRIIALISQKLSGCLVWGLNGETAEKHELLSCYTGQLSFSFSK